MKWLRNFMIGRNGVDHICIALIVGYMAISLIVSITGIRELMIIGYILWGICLFRILSRDIIKRGKENMAFLQWWNKISYKFRNKSNEIKSMKTHRIFKCPNCKLKLRVPKGKGKVTITCSRCKTKFSKRT
ncbi:DNA-directed RNA polymerase subunit RPC12/RpoP [Clostridium pascui]|uniref:hypothetical protein n=1 Tax=Clostridium pascui TaxID=46609 RepID=UPI00195E0F97|nr:hypothetical protein [Clostridium pascui]MBM7869896.1 DNA-directed RNA polymerase subunit RPC12/RpoP [Clostridium pascui]